MVLDAGACVHLHGKGRKQRSVPLWKSTVKLIRAWLKLNPEFLSTTALLPNRSGQAMTRSNVTQRLELAVKTAAQTTPSLRERVISPHTLRHYLPFRTMSCDLLAPTAMLGENRPRWQLNCPT